MTLLAARIGNDHTLIGLLDADGEVLAHWRLASEPRRTADEWGFLVSGLLGSGPGAGPMVGPGAGPMVGPGAGPIVGQGAAVSALADLDGLAVCSAVPAVQHAWRAMAATHLKDVRTLFVGPGVRTGVPLLVDNPREVGADRIANAVAASQLLTVPAIVVDFGTATTFDVVNAEGQYVGGVIAPGIETSLEALHRRGAQLRTVELSPPRSVIAKNTVEAMQSGMLLGAASQVDGLVGRIVAELGAPARSVTVAATGHLAALVVAECTTVTEHDPFLTLRGLRVLFDRN